MKFIVRPWASMVLAGIIFTACHKENSSTPPPTPVTPTPLQAYITADTSLSIFNAAITKAGDAALYGSADSVTVLIPTNDAFRAAGISQSTINAMSSGAVDSLLKYHFINQGPDLKTGVYTPYTTKLGPNIYGYGGATGMNYYNGSQATMVSVPSSKATVYRLNTPLGVPFATNASYLSSDTSLTYFSAALTRAGIDLSQDTGWTTVLAPTNNGFRNAGYATVADINSADSATLRHTLMYHVLPGQYFANSYSGLTSVPTYGSGQTITIGSSANGATFTGSGNSAPVGFAGNSQLAGSNTIFQPVNGVVLP
jgi:uncharacterized surface protein with fasciclin (FAS1) repeats